MIKGIPFWANSARVKRAAKAAVKAAAKLAVWIDAPAIGEVRAAKAAILAAMK